MRRTLSLFAAPLTADALCSCATHSLSLSLPHGILQLSAAGIGTQREDAAAATPSGQGREKS